MKPFLAALFVAAGFGVTLPPMPRDLAPRPPSPPDPVGQPEPELSEESRRRLAAAAAAAKRERRRQQRLARGGAR
jgi:hypothetical protein